MSQDSMRTLQQIEPVGDMEPYHIVPISYLMGTAMSAKDVMAAKVEWVERTGYRVLTGSISEEFLPYNAVIRVNEANTEDRMLDYLAQFGEALPAPGPYWGRLETPPVKRAVHADAEAPRVPRAKVAKKPVSKPSLNAPLANGTIEQAKARHIAVKGRTRL